MDITIPFVFALISYVLGIIVGRNNTFVLCNMKQV